MNLRTALELGRVSNLPTVWSNVIAASVLCAADLRLGPIVAMCLACSSFYVGGMYLNDYFDREIDTQTRPDRPIPRGDVTPALVRLIGFGLLGLGATIAVAVAALSYNVAATVIACAMLAVAIVVYDRHHKENVFGPVIMGLCRLMVYVTTACALSGRINSPTATAATLLFFYLIGLTYAAKTEHTGRRLPSWPLVSLGAAPLWLAAAATGLPQMDFVAFTAWLLIACLAGLAALGAQRMLTGDKQMIGPTVALLIAGIALLDACSIALAGFPQIALATACLCPATLGLQRWVAGT